MHVNYSILRTRLQTILLATAALFLAVILIGFPEQSFHSSLKGLKIWWEVLFPALLPLFIASELLMGFGVVHFMGVILEPLIGQQILEAVRLADAIGGVGLHRLAGGDFDHRDLTARQQPPWHLGSPSPFLSFHNSAHTVPVPGVAVAVTWATAVAAGRLRVKSGRRWSPGANGPVAAGPASVAAALASLAGGGGGRGRAGSRGRHRGSCTRISRLADARAGRWSAHSSERIWSTGTPLMPAMRDRVSSCCTT